MGCTPYDRMDMTEFKPKNTQDGFQYYEYTVRTDARYPLESDNAEKTRIKWLEIWLSDNNIETVNYEIVSRETLLRYKKFNIYDVHYLVRVPMKQ